MKILLSGGGTFGSVSPLIAVYQTIKRDYPSADFLWVGTKSGPEIQFIKSYGLEFKAIQSGKLRRYFSWQNFLDPARILIGFIQSLIIIKKFKPDIIVSSAAYVAVPLSWAGKFFKISVLIHQQDVRPSLANKIISSFAKKITVTFENSKNNFNPSKVVQTGNPARSEIYEGSKEKAIAQFKLQSDIAIILILGGGTGSKAINDLVFESVEQIAKNAQVIHITGKGKGEKIFFNNYLQLEFLTDEFKDVLAAADLVVCRASMSVLTECAALKKAVALIPIPNSHQEDNALEFSKNNAAIYLKQNDLTPEDFSEFISNIIVDKSQLENLSRNIEKLNIVDQENNLANQIIQIVKDAT
ncbi:UDP-N-acetylglucosamine--N-acetylmuramyl-(pentapeptide) pyrophosphoryl-undecaprenol N-acetylglucosamine transferase [Patescibacteria group bacterium]|nr:UDP-N-acetylglucosamine--N-acetylmuramyl-(pentapeptide) pyrophosphoryl-undecaprenol N-acetylglucosamine transferase [Patescibacteria group bacterium]